MGPVVRAPVAPHIVARVSRRNVALESTVDSPSRYLLRCLLRCAASLQYFRAPALKSRARLRRSALPTGVLAKSFNFSIEARVFVFSVEMVKRLDR